MLSKLSIRNAFKFRNAQRFTNTKLSKKFSSSFIVTSHYPDLEIPNVTLPEFLSSYIDKFENFHAIECCQTKRRYTYGDIRKKSSNLSKAFKKIIKLNEGDVVAIVLTNIPEYPIANLGILKANLVTSTVSPAFTAEEISCQLENSDAKAIITEVNLAPLVKKAIQLTGKNISVLIVKTKTDQSLPEGTIDFHDIVDTHFDYPDIQPCNPENLAFLPFSSGTTGLPKGVELTHKNLVANIIQNNHPELTFKHEASESFQEVLPTMLPLYHAFGHCVVMNTIPKYGGKLITLPKFNKNAYISMLKEYKQSTIMYLVPPIALMLTDEKTAEKEYLKNIRIIFSAAAPLAATDEQRLIEKFGKHITVVQGYGLTESSPIVTTLYPKLIVDGDQKKYAGSIGIPLPNTQVKIVDLEDVSNTPLGPNTTGELLVKGPQIMRGYRNLPQETRKTITEDGWLRTGDIGYYDKNRFFFISDRFKELIKVKGNQVAPAELEGVIRSFPGVADAAVIGIPHDTSGEVPRAYVVPNAEIKLSTELLNEFVNEKVARYKQLKGGIAIVDSIPKNPSGKILRRKIKEQFLKSVTKTSSFT